MLHHDYIFFLQNKNRQFWGVDSSGNVTINSIPYPLIFSPDGWQDTSIENIRNKKYWSIDRTVSAPFKYVEDGAKILKHIFYKKGTEESVYLVICELQLVYTPGVEYGYWYKQIFRSEIDLSTFEHAGPYITAANSEEGLAKHLKANENTVYEIPLNTTEAVNVKEDGIFLAMKSTWITMAGLYAGSDLLGVIGGVTEGKASGAAFFDIYKQTEPGDLTTSSEYFFIATADITGILLQGAVVFSSVISGPYTIKLKSSEGQNISLGNINGPGTITINQSFNAVSNEKFFLVLDPTGLTFGTITESNISLSLESRYAATYIKAHRPQYIWNELLLKATNGEYSAEDCPYFNTHSDKVFTSGNGIRGISDATLKLSINQFMGFWNTFDEVGIKEQDKKVLLDRKNTLIDQSDIIDLGAASNLRLSFDKELPFNELAVGYPDIKNENGFVNGKNEFNTTFVYSLGTTKNPRKYDKTSQVRASCYDIENVRIENEQKESTDNRSDNEPYVLHIQSTITTGVSPIEDHYLLDRSLNAFVSGVEKIDSVFNIVFSPKRCFKRSSDYLHSCGYLIDNKTFKFISADRNKDMAYINGADIIVENADEPVGDLDYNFFLPVIMQADINPPDDLLDELDSNPMKIFQFTFNGDTYKGIPIKNGINPKRNRTQTYELWPTADTDLTPLIDYYGG